MLCKKRNQNNPVKSQNGEESIVLELWMHLGDQWEIKLIYQKSRIIGNFTVVKTVFEEVYPLVLKMDWR